MSLESLKSSDPSYKFFADAVTMETVIVDKATGREIGRVPKTVGMVSSAHSTLGTPTPPYSRTTVTKKPSYPEGDLNLLLNFCLNKDMYIRKTGSQLVEGVDPEDHDYVVEDLDGVIEDWLLKEGYERGGSERPEEEFTSYKKYYGAIGKPINVIVSHSREHFRKYLIATDLLKRLQPKDKADRIAIFNRIFEVDKTKRVPF